MRNKGKNLSRSDCVLSGDWEYHLSTGDLKVSENMYRIFELDAQSKPDFLHSVQALFNEAEREKNQEEAENSIRSGKPFTYYQQLRLPDGRSKTIRVTGSAVADSAGIRDIIKGSCEEISRDGFTELQQFFQLSSDLLCILDSDGRIINQSLSFLNLLDTTEAVLKGNLLTDYFRPEQEELFRDTLRHLFRNGLIENQETTFWLNGKKKVILSWAATFDRDSNRIFASARDVTGKADFEGLLLQTKIEAEKSKAKDIFLANMSHEIRTPLNAIIGFNDLLSKSGLNADQQKKVDIISSASRTLSVIVNDILDLSKLDSGKLELDIKPFSLEQVCKQVIQLESSKAKNKGIKLFFSFDNDIPEILNGDDVRLTQILMNLISNAIKFTEKGHVELQVKENQRHGNISEIAFRVSDTGIGVPRDKIRKIFRRFSQAESYTTRLYGGTGLGLSIVKSLVKLHNGKLSVNSQEGVGSVFSFNIPYELSDQEPETDKIAFPVEQPVDWKNARLLLVEDNEHNQMLATSYLEKYGIQTDLAANGKQAVGLLKENSYDIILMDLQMPLLDGIGTTEIIRRTLRLNTPIIACSAHALASERRKCLESGMNDYISKPYSEEGLINVVGRFLSRRTTADGNILELIPATVRADSPDDGKAENSGKGMENSKLERAVLAKLPDDIRVISEALDKHDWQSLEFKAHHLISSLSVLQLPEGIDLSRKLEDAARKKEEKHSFHLAKELMDYLKGIKTEKV